MGYCAPADYILAMTGETYADVPMIDAHVHVWSPDHSRYPLAPGFSPEDPWLPSFTPDDHAAIGGAVVPINLVQMTWYGLDHSYILDLIASDPERFTGTGVVPAVCDVALPAPEHSMCALATGGIRAFRLRGRAAQPPREHVGEQWLGSEAYQRMFACAANENLVLSFLCGPSDLLEIGRMCELFPQTKVIIDHCGGVRVRDSTIDSNDLRSLLALAAFPEVYVKFGPVHGLGDPSGGSRDIPFTDTLPLLRAIVSVYGAQRVLWESDLGGPIQMNNPEQDFAACLDLIREHADFLDATQCQQILGGNARRLLWAS